jgi:hypothetical protein
MTAGTAALILAYNNPQQVRRLVGALDGLDVFLHCDSRTPAGVLSAMASGTHDVVPVPRYCSPRRLWGAVEAELAGLRAVLDRSSAEHIVVLSGSCYPLVSVGELQDELASWRGLSRLQLDPIPYALWSRSSLIRDGGSHRFDLRFLARGGRVILVGGYPIPTGRRAVPDDLRLHASSQWKIYARDHAETLLRVLDERPDLVRFWSSTFLPEESCLASILASPALAGSVTEELRHGLPWYVDWRGSKRGHPRWLSLDHLPNLYEGRRRAALRPDDPPSCGGPARVLFARKMGPGSAELLDRIDEQFRV